MEMYKTKRHWTEIENQILTETSTLTESQTLIKTKMYKGKNKGRDKTINKTQTRNRVEINLTKTVAVGTKIRAEEKIQPL